MNTALERLRELRVVKVSEAQEAVKPVSTQLDGMTVADFAASGRVLRVYSDVLLEEVLIAADNAALAPGERRTVYQASELPALLDITPEGLRLLHRVKAAFPGATLLD